MSDVLLDSNLIIYSVDPADTLVRPFIRLHAAFVSEISIVEALGYHRLREIDRMGLELFFANCRLLPIDRTIIRAATELRQKRKMSLGDALIAGTAIIHELILATHNAADFQAIDGLTVIDPLVK